MKRNAKTLKKRARYVKNQMNNRKNGATAVSTAKKLATKLFLSESTIWKDYLIEIEIETA